MRAITFAPMLLVLSAACVACGGADRHAVTATNARVAPAMNVASPTSPSFEVTAGGEEHNHYHAPSASFIAPAEPVPTIDLATWRERWPVAARDLAAWRKTYPNADAKMREWDAKGDRFETMVEWAVGHPYEDFNAFLLPRTGWARSEAILSEQQYRPAMDAFLLLVRRSSEASLELVKHPNGFAWLDAKAPPTNPNVSVAANAR
jgi:hypothetical protein